MLAKELSIDMVIPLKTSDTGEMALSMMEDLKVTHLPVVNGDKLLGVISETELLNLNRLSDPIDKHRLSLSRPYVMHSQHFFDVIRLAAAERLTLVPVLDKKGLYMGSITLSRIIEMMGEMASLKQPGGIIVLEVNIQDYSLGEISRIVESNDAKVLSAYITSFPDSTRLEVTVKINRIDLSSIMQTFSRFNYTITASFSEESQWEELLNNRYESLMNYLNV